MYKTIQFNSLAFAAICMLVLATANPASAGSDWPQFRGPDGRGVVENPALPDEWSATKNVEWKEDIAGRGWSSPIVSGGKVFLTTAISEEEMEAAKKGLYFGGNRPKPETPFTWQVIALDLETGKRLWEKTLHHGVPIDGIHVKNSFASETPVTDGERLYVYFGNVGVFCLDFDGNVLWEKKFEARKSRFGWGTAASPVLHEDRLYLVNDNDAESYIVALNKMTGDEIWRVTREEGTNWSTPFVWETPQRKEIVTPGTDLVRSYDLDGKLLWSLEGMSSITIAMPYTGDGLLYISSGYVGDRVWRPIYAIRPGASGDISLIGDETSNDYIVWSNRTAAPYNPSTLLYKNRLYVLYDRGTFACFDSHDGGIVYEPQRIPKGRGFTSSPWAYNGKIFCMNEDGVTFVIKAGDVFEVVGTNPLAEDDMGMASPAIVGDRLLIRTAARIYSIRNSEL